MKKFIFTLTVLALVSSCNKEKKSIEATSENVETTTNTIDSANSSIKLPEFSTANMVDHLADKKNDTIYVTNFFATWCGPCIQEIPHFVKKKNEMKDQPVKFTFVSIDAKKDWNTKVVDFGNKYNLSKDIVLLDGEQLDAAFFKNNFQTWDGGGIPFTIIKKGDKREEIFGSTSEVVLNEKIKNLQ